VCLSLRPERNMCGDTKEHAMQWLRWMERITSPSRGARAAPAREGAG
jgi:hypothetical protein